MGGRYGDGAIQPASINDETFKEKWHSRALAVTLATGSLRQWNLDMSRHARECLPPKDYCAFSYYDKWISALANLLVNKGVISADEFLDPIQDLSLSDLSSDDEREVPKHYIGNVVLPIVPLAILDDFSNNGIIPFVMNARNSHLELIAKTHPIRVEIMLPFLYILITFSKQRIYFRMILVPENRVRQQRKSIS